jgi:hypothetical protein
VCLILFLTITGVHSGSFSDPHSLHVIGIFIRYTLCLQIVFGFGRICMFGTVVLRRQQRRSPFAEIHTVVCILLLYAGFLIYSTFPLYIRCSSLVSMDRFMGLSSKSDPRWSPASTDFPNGGYRKIDQSVESMILWVLPFLVVASFLLSS